MHNTPGTYSHIDTVQPGPASALLQIRQPKLEFIGSLGLAIHQQYIKIIEIVKFTSCFMCYVNSLLKQTYDQQMVRSETHMDMLLSRLVLRLVGEKRVLV